MNKRLCSSGSVAEGRQDQMCDGVGMDAYKLVTQILAEHLGCDDADFTGETELEQLGIDSVEHIELVMELEDASGMELCPEEQPRTVGDLVHLLVRD